MPELTLEQALQAARKWRDEGANIDDVPLGVICALLEAIETMSPVVNAADNWRDKPYSAPSADLCRAVDTYREKTRKGE